MATPDEVQNLIESKRWAIDADVEDQIIKWLKEHWTENLPKVGGEALYRLNLQVIDLYAAYITAKGLNQLNESDLGHFKYRGKGFDNSDWAGQAHLYLIPRNGHRPLRESIAECGLPFDEMRWKLHPNKNRKRALGRLNAEHFDATTDQEIQKVRKEFGRFKHLGPTKRGKNQGVKMNKQSDELFHEYHHKARKFDNPEDTSGFEALFEDGKPFNGLNIPLPEPDEVPLPPDDRPDESNRILSYIAADGDLAKQLVARTFDYFCVSVERETPSGRKVFAPLGDSLGEDGESSHKYYVIRLFASGRGQFDMAADAFESATKEQAFENQIKWIAEQRNSTVSKVKSTLTHCFKRTIAYLSDVNQREASDLEQFRKLTAETIPGIRNFGPVILEQ
jgi:hypothetical protein